jgi:hypothetical protein
MQSPLYDDYFSLPLPPQKKILSGFSTRIGTLVPNTVRTRIFEEKNNLGLIWH